MNGPQDLGGMQGFGPVLPETDEPVFHGDWEKRVFALMMAVSPFSGAGFDRARSIIENKQPADYLSKTYYERWFDCVMQVALETGALTAAEADAVIQGRTPDKGSIQGTAIPGAALMGAVTGGAPTSREGDAKPRFSVGSVVRTKVVNPTGHTRLPRYARGKSGVVVDYHGLHVFPDTNAAGAGEAPSPLYTVRFAARELWGEEAPLSDSVSLELWEPYLEPGP